MISEIDLEDWILYPETPLDKMKEGSDFLYRGGHCVVKKKNFFSYVVVNANGVEFELDFYRSEEHTSELQSH